MPVQRLNIVTGSIGDEHDETGPTPGWAPAWLPSKPTMDYLITLASFTFLVLGSLYFLGLRPAGAVVQAKRELAI